MPEEVLTYKGTFRDYVILTKPGLVAMVLVTTVAGIYIGHRGMPDSALVFWTLLGTCLAACGSTILNNVYDRDIDSLMVRTRTRPMPRGAIRPSAAVASGVSIILAAFLILSYFVNMLSALLAMTASVVYVFVYTHLMKRRTPNATVVGGISGALPPVIGYASVTGHLTVEALILFLIMFIWQPSHFWFLAIKHAKDYERAAIPAMPVARGISATKFKILMFNSALFPVSLLPFFYNMAGKIYLLTAVCLGLFYLFASLRLLFMKEENPFRFFYYSNLYLFALFSVMMIDTVR